MSDLRGREDFERLNVRAGLTVQRLGVVNVSIGDTLGRALATYGKAVEEVGS